MRSRRIALGAALAIGAALAWTSSASATDYAWAGNAGLSDCSTVLSPNVAAQAYVNTFDRVTWVYHKFTVNSTHSNAQYLDCTWRATPVKLGRIRGYNRYVFSGVHVSGCDVGWPGGFNCHFEGGVSTFTDTQAGACTGCSFVAFDEYGLQVDWLSGVLTHYQHTATAYFTGYNGSQIHVQSNVDHAL